MTTASRSSRARGIATRLSSALTRYLEGKLDEAALVKALRKLALDIEQAPALKPQARSEDESGAIVARVFAYWQQRMMKPKAKATPGRRDKIRARLKEGYTEGQLRQAIDACAASEFHMGQNDRNQAYNDVTLIFRNGETVERFMGMAGAQDPQHAEPPEIRALQQDADEALRRGDHDGYNRANAAIRAHRAANTRGSAGGAAAAG